MLERTAWWAHISHILLAQLVSAVNALDLFVANLGPTHFAFGIVVMAQAVAHVTLAYLSPSRRRQSLANLSTTLRILCPSMPTFFAVIHAHSYHRGYPELSLVEGGEKIATECSSEGYIRPAA